MNAKEIVFRECERQAKFGYEPSWEDFAIAGKQIGIKEVVEFVQATYGMPDPTGNGATLWQAQKKKWGIDEEVSDNIC